MNSMLRLEGGSGQVIEVPVLYMDEHLLAIDKPAGLPVVPGAETPDELALMPLLHAGIAKGNTWSRQRSLSFLMHAHGLDAEATGALLLARSKEVLVKLANLFSSEKPVRAYLAIVMGVTSRESFEINVGLSPDQFHPGRMRVNPQSGKRSRTGVTVVQTFERHSLVRCEAFTDRPCQLRAHLRHVGHAIVGDGAYGGRPLMLSTLKNNYRLKPGKKERPLISEPALHSEWLSFDHPVTGEPLKIEAPWPRDLRVAVKYLERCAAANLTADDADSTVTLSETSSEQEETNAGIEQNPALGTGVDGPQENRE